MKLKKEEVEKIADLARLELTEEEIDLYGEQISGVLEYIDKLTEVDTNGVEPTAQVTGLSNVLRKDEVAEWDEEERENAIGQAPETLDRQYLVKKVLS